MTIVITCADPRVDLTGIEGEDGEFAVLRTVGGRVTSDVLAQLAILRTMHPGATHVVLVHHTDCHAAQLADPELAAAAAAAAGVEAADVAARAVVDPSTSVTADVAVLRRELPRSARITGMVLDVTTGATRTAWRSG